jgi:nucleotide sugar dehydrogenase
MQEGELTIDVVGIGKMGLPLAALLAREGANVIGVRRNEAMVESINKGECPIGEEPELPVILADVVGRGRLMATTDAGWAARQSDVMLILVPLLAGEGRPDFSIIEEACRGVAGGLSKGDLVVIETTMPPGSIRGRLLPVLEESGLVAGEDFGLAHAPERLMTGKVIRNLYRYPKVLGGLDEASLEAAAGIYSPFGEVLRVSSLEAAELVKVSEGVYRDVNIAYANTLALFCEKHRVDVWEVIRAANHKTSDYCHIHLPGSGVGGHCIPVYPWFIISQGMEYSTDVSILRESRRINDQMPLHMKELINLCLADQGKEREESSVGVLGVAFRGGVKENRFSPGVALLRSLKTYGRVLAHDPLYTPEEIGEMGFQPGCFEEILECDCVALVTAHQEYRDLLPKLKSISERVVDGRNLVPGAVYKIGNLTNRPK